MSYLLDTNVVSELRKGPRCNPGVAAWLADVDEELYLSALVVGEIRLGIERVRRRDPAGASALDRWLTRIQTEYGHRVLPVTAEIAEAWGRLAAPVSLPVVDGLMAATAMVHGLTLVTRNVRDLSRTPAATLNPFSGSR